MSCFQQKERDIINPDTEIHYAILSSFTNTKFPHQHDFFEVSLVLDGKQQYKTNNFDLILESGSLILVRPGEVHSRAYMESGLHINVAFSEQVASDLFNYLGKGFPMHWLMDLTNLPHLKLSNNETNILRKKLQELGSYNIDNPTLNKTKLRIVVFNLFTDYFMRYAEADSLPKEDWLKTTLLEMESIDNFSLGIEQLIKISGKTHEHLCRVFKEQLDCTPTEYINKIRLNYSANMLIHSDHEIVDICFDVGFQSLSHFYHLFKQQYNMSPLKFKKKYQTFL